MGAFFMKYHDTTITSRLLLYAVMVLALAPYLFPSAACAQEPTEPVCISCHSTLPEKFSQPVKLWRGSIHADNGIYCNGCHGGDPNDAANAMNPERGFLGVPTETAIPAFCGRCHVGVLKDYLASAHGRKLGKGGPTCVTCHSNHHVVKASLALINEQSCSRCHSFERARVIRAAMQETEAMIVAIDERISGFKKTGTDTEKLEKELFAVRNQFHTLFHSVDVELVKNDSAQIQADLRKIQVVLDGLDTVHQRRMIAGAAAVSIMLMIALVLHLLRKTYD